MGNVGEGIMTVRFTFRGNVIRIYEAGYWKKAERLMLAKIKYLKPYGDLKIVKTISLRLPIS